MDDLVLIQYLKDKGLIKEHDEILHKEVSASDYNEFLENFKEITKNMSKEDKHSFVDSLKDYGCPDEHFTEPYAKFLVSKMWHMEGSNKHIGEKYSLIKAKEIKEKYANLVPTDVTVSDIYVAINSHYHHYFPSFQSWFGDRADHYIIDTAMTYWFCEKLHFIPITIHECFEEE